MRIPDSIGARFRKVAQVISRKPPVNEVRLEHERIYRELQRRDTEMSIRYERTTRVERVRTYLDQFIYDATLQLDPLPRWICGHCRRGDLGAVPRVGDYCPFCKARVEEVTRSMPRAIVA